MIFFKRKREYSEQELLDGCKKNSRSCQNLLYEKFSPKMLGICLRYSSEINTAEDILQEGFIKIFSSIESFRNEGSFEGWMKRIMVRTAIEQYRKTIQIHAYNDLVDDNQDFSDISGVDSLSTRDLLKMIQQLPSGFRNVFNLYAIEGYSHQEISEMLNISEGTSKSQLSRARGILQDKILKENNIFQYEVYK